MKQGEPALPSDRVQPSTKPERNRWLIALSAVGIHVSIGSVYAWSVFNLPLETAYGWSRSEVAATFSLAIFFLGLSAAILGRYVEAKGPQQSGTLAAFLWGIGLLGASVATYLESVPLLWLSYGVIGGMGLGVGYITPVSTLVAWFPDRRGFATGLAIMGFGFGAMFGAPIFRFLMDAVGIPSTFLLSGLAYMMIMLGAAAYLEKPPIDWQPQGSRPSEAKRSPENFGSEELAVSVRQALRMPSFYGLWVMMFLNISCGIAVIYAASPLAQESLGVSAAEAAAIVGLMSLFNGFGRIAWASLSDYLGRSRTYMAFFLIQIIAFQLLPHLNQVFLFQVVLFTILTCYGGGFATLPAYISDLFGTKHLAAIHGLLLTAWAAAGLAGPQFAAMVRTMTGSYTTTLYIFAALFVVALAVAVFMQLFARQQGRQRLQLRYKGAVS